jgi:hypothetical protein
MINRVMRIRCRPVAFAVFGIVLGGLAALPGPASARVWVGFGFPLFVGPPAYYPPPAYYYPPPPYYPPPAYYGGPPGAPYAYAAPPPGYSRPGGHYTPSGQSCATGGAVCPMEHPVASGSSCYCTTGQGRIWGRAP